jgi:hypothetical protein
MLVLIHCGGPASETLHKDGKTPHEHMFSGMVQISDIGQPARAIGEALDAWHPT